MNFTKKLDRAVQWAGEKMGGEAKTNMSDQFKMLETEMAVRHEGMDRLQRSMTAYTKWAGRRGETFEDKEKGLPISYLGRTMVSHGEDFEPDSEFGSCLVALGRGEERLAAAQEQYVADATAAWLESLERSLAMMKEYQAARKKLENRRLAYDASITKMQKAKRDDFRVEEELRASRAKYEESSEDVLRRMQDIKDAEQDSVRDLTSFLDCQIEYHDRCTEELRRIRGVWPASGASSAGGGPSRNLGGRSRSNTARSHTSITNSNSFGSLAASQRQQPYADEEPEPAPARVPIPSNTRLASNSFQPEKPPRPVISSRANTFHSQANATAANTAVAAVSSLRNGLRPVGRTPTNSSYGGCVNGAAPGNVFDDGEDTASGGSAGGRSGSPDWADRSTSPATSYGSLSRTSSNIGLGSRKPPPPPPTRAKKPPPPVPVKREVAYTH